MAWLIALFGLVIAIIGVIGITCPERFISAMMKWQPRSLYLAAIGIRLVIGGLFIYAAASTRFPRVINVLGIVAIVAAVLVALLGPRRLESLMQWWFRQPLWVIRVSCSVTFLFGGFLIYCGL
jgi:hypothetical protein